MSNRIKVLNNYVMLNSVKLQNNYVMSNNVSTLFEIHKGPYRLRISIRSYRV